MKLGFEKILGIGKCKSTPIRTGNDQYGKPIITVINLNKTKHILNFKQNGPDEYFFTPWQTMF